MGIVSDGIWQERVEKLKEIAKKHGREFEPGITLGWSQILIDLNNTLEAIVPDYSVGQIKEKFSSMRFYLNPLECSSEDFEKVQEAVRLAEHRSMETCEICGERGFMDDGSWAKCYCIEHSAKSKEGMSFSEMTKEFYLQCGFEWEGW